MNNEQDRIKLAEAMGWTRGRISACVVMGKARPVQRWVTPSGKDVPALPDPFTDANDDYAVLEWMRRTCPGGMFDDTYGSILPKWDACLCGTIESHGSDFDYGAYEIGDYARAALKSLEGVE